MQTPNPNNTAGEDQNQHGVGPRQVPPGRIRWYLNPVFMQVATILSLLIIGAQAFIYNDQRKVMKDTRDVMIEQTSIMKNTLRMNRAYVGVGNPIANIKGGQVTIVLENVGRLPADKISVEVRESRRIGDDAPNGSITPFEPGQQLIPGGKMSLVVQLARFQPNEVENIVAKTETLYVSGTIKYDDGFGNPDTTNFGFEYIPSPNEGWTPRPELIKK